MTSLTGKNISIDRINILGPPLAWTARGHTTSNSRRVVGTQPRNLRSTVKVNSSKDREKDESGEHWEMG